MQGIWCEAHLHLKTPRWWCICDLDETKCLTFVMCSAIILSFTTKIWDLERIIWCLREWKSHSFTNYLPRKVMQEEDYLTLGSRLSFDKGVQSLLALLVSSWRWRFNALICRIQEIIESNSSILLTEKPNMQLEKYIKNGRVWSWQSWQSNNLEEYKLCTQRFMSPRLCYDKCRNLWNLVWLEMGCFLQLQESKNN